MGFRFVSLGSKVAYTGERVKLSMHAALAMLSSGHHCEIYNIGSKVGHCLREQRDIFTFVG